MDAEVIQQLLGVGSIKAWAIAIAVTYAVVWLFQKGPDILITFLLGRLDRFLEGHGSEDVDLAVLLQEVCLALVKFAERKIPDAGLGAERMQLIMDMLLKLPLLGRVVRRKPAEVRAALEAAVARMDGELKKREKPG